MTAKGHMTLATTVALISFNTLPYFLLLSFKKLGIIYFSAIIGSIFPDIDEENSYIGRRLPLFSIITSSIFKHRTLTHYLILPLIIAIAGLFTSGLNQLICFSFAFGILMHDVGDMLTKGGINGFFFPLFSNAKIALLPRALRFYTNSIAEYMIILFLTAINRFLAYLLIKRILH